MIVVCVRAFGDFRPGDTTEVPDGATVSPLFFVPQDTLQAPQGAPAQNTKKAPAPIGSGN